MKRARLIDKKPAENEPLEEAGENSVINTEITKTKPVKFSKDGIVAFQRNTKPTEEGLEVEQIKPSLFDERGRHLNSESELKGECHICYKIVSVIFYCCECKKLLCEEHAHAYKEDGEVLYFCEEDFIRKVMNQNMWAKRKQLKSHEEYIRKNKQVRPEQSQS